MKRKQRKSPPWRRFGHVILIIIKIGEVLLWFSPRIINALRSHIKHSKECSSDIQTLRSWLKKTWLRLIFQPTSQCLDLTKHSSSCLIYYIKNCCQIHGESWCCGQTNKQTCLRIIKCLAYDIQFVTFALCCWDVK